MKVLTIITLIVLIIGSAVSGQDTTTEHVSQENDVILSKHSLMAYTNP